MILTNNCRVNASTAARLGSGPVNVQSGSQIYFNRRPPHGTNTFNIAGSGWLVPGYSNFFAAMRLRQGAGVGGPVNLLGDAWLS